MSVIAKLLSALTQTQFAPEEVFSAKTYTGTGAAQAISNGINLSGYGGIVWTKARNSASMHAVWDTGLGEGSFLTTSGNGGGTSSQSGSITDSSNALTSFNADGFSLGSDPSLGIANSSGTNYISWTFRQAERFFMRATVSHTSGVASAVNLASLGTPGMAVVKRASGTSEWITWHRSLSSGDLVLLNSSAPKYTGSEIGVAGTTLTIAASQPTGTYVVYAWAHDEEAAGSIQCGSFLTDLDGVTDIALPWEPQYVLMAPVVGSAGGFRAFDTARVWNDSASDNATMIDLYSAELVGNFGGPSASGFSVVAGGAASQYGYIYMAIRKPIAS